MNIKEILPEFDDPDKSPNDNSISALYFRETQMQSQEIQICYN